MKTTIYDFYKFIKQNNIDLSNKSIKVNTQFGYYNINNIDITEKNASIIKIVLEDNFLLEASPNHRLWINNNWVKLKNININDIVMTKDGYRKVISIENLDVKEDLYDLEVDKIHEYYTNGIVSHNSSVKDAIEYSIYGKVIGKNLKDLPNRINKALEVEINIDINGKNLYIKRGIEPNIFKVEYEGDEKFGDKANKTKQQELIEQLINIPQVLFNNVISLSVNDFKSFIDMSPDDKRKIIDRIFGLDIINKMNESLKNDIKETKKKESDFNLIKRSIETDISDLEDSIEDTKIEINSINNEEFIKINTKIQKLQEEFEKTELIIDNKQTSINELDVKYDKIYNIEYKLKNNKSNLIEKIELFSQNKCPLCETPFKTDHFHKILDDYKKDLELTESKIVDVAAKKSLMIKKKNDIHEKIHELSNKKTKLYTNIELLKTKLNTVEIDNSKEIKVLEDLLSNKRALLKIKQKEIQDIQEESKFNDYISDILSPKGFKKFYIKSILPIINKKIPEYLKMLNVPYSIKFNESFDSKITHLGEEIPIQTLSTGEKKKMDICVLISILYFLKLKIPTINLLFLDEIFSSLDVESQTSLLYILKDLSNQLKFHTFIINHSIFEDGIFNNIYKIEKINGFSKIKKLTHDL